MTTQEMSKKELLNTANQLQEVIDKGCFGSRDVLFMDACLDELEKRGCEIQQSTTYRIVD